MAHTAICGMTMSGKTTLGIELAKRSAARGFPVLFYSPERGDWSRFPAQFRTDDLRELLDVAKRSSNCAIFIDEGMDVLTNRKEHADYIWFATRSRHRGNPGHRCFFMMQDAAGIHPIYRRMCSNLYLYTVDAATARAWADAFQDESLMRATALKQYHYMHKQRGFGPDGKPWPALIHEPIPCKKND